MTLKYSGVTRSPTTDCGATFPVSVNELPLLTAAMFSKTSFCCAHDLKSGAETHTNSAAALFVEATAHKLLGSFTGGFLRSIALRALKMVVFAAMPSASVNTATVVNPGDLRSMRAAKRKSCQSVSKKDSQPAE